jgi:hypothetical protein
MKIEGLPSSDAEYPNLGSFGPGVLCSQISELDGPGLTGNRMLHGESQDLCEAARVRGDIHELTVSARRGRDR